MYTFSATLGAGVGFVNLNPSVAAIALIFFWQVFRPANAIFAGAGVLLLVSSLVYFPVWTLVT